MSLHRKIRFSKRLLLYIYICLYKGCFYYIIFTKPNRFFKTILPIVMKNRFGFFCGQNFFFKSAKFETFFGDNSKSIGLRLFNFFRFFWFTNTCRLLKLKVGVLFLLPESLGLLPECLILPYKNKPRFRPTSGHWISTFYSLKNKEADWKIF